MRVRARPQGRCLVHAAQLSVAPRHGCVRPMPFMSEGTHVLVQDLVTMVSPKKGYTVDMEHQSEDGPCAACRVP